MALLNSIFSPSESQYSPLGFVWIIDYYCEKAPDEPDYPLDIDRAFPPRYHKTHLPGSNHNLTCCSPLTIISTLITCLCYLQTLSSWQVFF